MANITNEHDVSLSLAVWLLHDTYDFIDKENYISVTSLMKPLKQIILGSRVIKQDQVTDVTDFIARKLGSTIHDGIENSWVHGYERSLKLLGYPQSTIDQVCINPSDDDIKFMERDGIDYIPIYLEQREFRTKNGFIIGGKFDLVIEGRVEDNKSTSVFGWVYGTRDDEHILQGSLYRWIDSARERPRITEDIMRVNYIFTDWQKSGARTNPKYPQKRVEYKEYKLRSIEDMDEWVGQKVQLINRNWTAPESQLPRCTDEEIWRGENQYRYYKDPEKAKDPNARSSKNFDTLAEANKHKADMGVGVVVTKLGEVKRCQLYCPAFDICEQAKEYFPT